MATKLRAVGKGEVAIRRPTPLRAKQVFTFTLETGGEGFGMVDESGVIYMMSVAGWTPCNMMEAIDDPTTV